MPNPEPQLSETRQRLLVLARSYKRGGWCVAGKIAHGPRQGEWVRPVSTRPDMELMTDDIILHSCGRVATPLDIAELPLGHRTPHLHQPENTILAGGEWRQVEGNGAHLAIDLLDHPLTIWGGSPCISRNDRLTEATAFEQPGSLLLVRVTGFRLEHRSTPWGKKWRGCFYYGDIAYDLAVTDPDATSLVPPETASIVLPDVLLTLSLSLPYYGHCYKLIAAIMPFA